MYCFPNKSRQERQQLVKENFIHMGYTLVENPVSWWASDQRIQKRAEIIGMDNLQNALDSGKDVLLLSSLHSTRDGGRIITHHIAVDLLRTLKN